jgi:hypothetical protein
MEGVRKSSFERMVLEEEKRNLTLIEEKEKKK